MVLSIAARVLTLALLIGVGATHARAAGGLAAGEGDFVTGTPLLDVRAPALARDLLPAPVASGGGNQ